MPTLPLDDPLDWFDRWMDKARSSPEPEPTAMSLATVDKQGHPTVRIVLLKDYDRKGFVFYTNLNSAKGQHLRDCPQAGICFLWKELGYQVRIRGGVEQVEDAVADAYFQSRPRGSKVGAWASRQSEQLDGRSTLEERVEHFRDKFRDQPVPRPPFWSGFRVMPERFEFWKLKADRLHDRWEFVPAQDGDDVSWQRHRLYP